MKKRTKETPPRRRRPHSLEGVPVAGLLHGLDHGLVDAEGDGDAEEGEQQVGDDADDAERRQREQHQHGQAERQAGLLGVPPVDQILHCVEESGDTGREGFFSFSFLFCC